MNLNEVEILLVEDNIDDANLTIRALKKHRLANNLYHVKDGAEAFDFIYAQGQYSERDIQSKPKLILLDLKMPKVSGIEVLQKIKSDKSTKAIPVVVMTSSKEDPDIKICYDLGVNSYLVKPVDFEGFFNMVSDLGMYWMVLNEVSNG